MANHADLLGCKQKDPVGQSSVWGHTEFPRTSGEFAFGIMKQGWNERKN